MISTIIIIACILFTGYVIISNQKAIAANQTTILKHIKNK